MWVDMDSRFTSCIVDTQYCLYSTKWLKLEKYNSWEWSQTWLRCSKLGIWSSIESSSDSFIFEVQFYLWTCLVCSVFNWPISHPLWVHPLVVWTNLPWILEWPNRPVFLATCPRYLAGSGSQVYICLALWKKIQE